MANATEKMSEVRACAPRPGLQEGTFTSGSVRGGGGEALGGGDGDAQTTGMSPALKGEDRRGALPSGGIS